MSDPGVAAEDALIEEAAWSAAAAFFGAELPTARDLAAAVIERSERYTTRRDALHQALTGRAGRRDLAARALFFALADQGKMRIPLGELATAGALPTASTWRVCDLGAGTGAMSYALCGLAARRGRPIDRIAIDSDTDALALGETILSRVANGVGAELTSRAIVDRLERPATLLASHGPFELIVAGTVLNEIADATHRLAVVKAAVAALAPGGALIVTEPALRESSRNLHALRDAVLAEGIANVFAPCTHQAIPCPMLANDSDWCHEDRVEVLPPRTRDLSRQTSLRAHGLKFSYLVLVRERRNVAEVFDSATSSLAPLRVVSHQAKEKGKMTAFVCGAHGRESMRLLRRNRAPENRSFEGVERGDLITTTGQAEVADTDVIARWRLDRRTHG